MKKRNPPSASAAAMPETLADKLSAAAAILHECHELAEKILATSAKGLQTAEPRSLSGIIGAAAGRIAVAADRARFIPNINQESAPCE